MVVLEIVMVVIVHLVAVMLEELEVMVVQDLRGWLEALEAQRLMEVKIMD
jgi:hypothetical protein